MLYCKACRISVSGTHKSCPLCGGNLSGSAEEKESYPILKPNGSHTKKIIQIISITALIAAIICITINVIIPTKIFWALFVVFGLGCGWLWAVVGLVKKSKPINSIVWQLALLSASSFLWDWFTGRHGWSIDFVFPCVCVGAMLAIIVLSKIMRMPYKDYIVNLIICAVMGIVPIIFLAAGLLRVIIPSVICAAVSLIVIAVQLIFNWKAMYREISKKLHL